MQAANFIALRPGATATADIAPKQSDKDFEAFPFSNLREACA
jgi:hypothetical protein